MERLLSGQESKWDDTMLLVVAPQCDQPLLVLLAQPLVLLAPASYQKTLLANSVLLDDQSTT